MIMFRTHFGLDAIDFDQGVVSSFNASVVKIYSATRFQNSNDFHPT
jgi:hypothetical protein